MAHRAHSSEVAQELFIAFRVGDADYALPSTQIFIAGVATLGERRVLLLDVARIVDETTSPA